MSTEVATPGFAAGSARSRGSGRWRRGGVASGAASSGSAIRSCCSSGSLREVVEVLLLGRLVPNELEGPLHRGEADAVVRLHERHRRAFAVVREERRAREVRRRPELQEIEDRGREIELRRRLIGDDARRHVPLPAQGEARMEGLLVGAEPVEVDAVLVGRKAVVADEDHDRVAERGTLLELVEERREPSVGRAQRGDEVAPVLRRVPGLGDVLRVVAEGVVMRRVRGDGEDGRARARVPPSRRERRRTASRRHRPGRPCPTSRGRSSACGPPPSARRRSRYA